MRAYVWAVVIATALAFVLLCIWIAGDLRR